MFRLELGPGDLAQSRFTISPLHETVVAVRALSGIGPGADEIVRRWLAPRRGRFARLRRDTPSAGVLIDLLSASMYTPTFLAPPPDPGHRTLTAQLDLVRAKPPALARAEI